MMEKMFFLATIGLIGAPAVAQTSPDAPSAFADTRPLGSTELADVAGRSDTSLLVRADNDATVSHNSVSGQSTTGTINIGADALGNLSGLSVFSANTGNNVAINSSLNLNVSIRP